VDYTNGGTNPRNYSRQQSNDTSLDHLTVAQTEARRSKWNEVLGGGASKKAAEGTGGASPEDQGGRETI